MLDFACALAQRTTLDLKLIQRRSVTIGSTEVARR